MPDPAGSATFEARVALLRRYYEMASAGREQRFIDRYVAHDVRVVTRFGALDGAEGKRYLEQYLASQRKSFAIHFEPEAFVEAPGDHVIALLTVTRVGVTPHAGELTAWPANVFRFRDAAVVYFEGYQDRRTALRDFGVGKSRERAARSWWRRRPGVTG